MSKKIMSEGTRGKMRLRGFRVVVVVSVIVVAAVISFSKPSVVRKPRAKPGDRMEDDS